MIEAAVQTAPQCVQLLRLQTNRRLIDLRMTHRCCFASSLTAYLRDISPLLCARLLDFDPGGTADVDLAISIALFGLVSQHRPPPVGARQYRRQQVVLAVHVKLSCEVIRVDCALFICAFIFPRLQLLCHSCLIACGQLLREPRDLHTEIWCEHSTTSGQVALAGFQLHACFGCRAALDIK